MVIYSLVFWLHIHSFTEKPVTMSSGNINHMEGLTDVQVTEARSRYGSNELTLARRDGFFFFFF